MGKGGMTRVIEQRKQAGWTVQIRKHKTTGGITVYITGPGILSATLPIDAAFNLTELLDETCDSLEDSDL